MVMAERTGKLERVAIMQPYFFPYLGYVSLLKHTDRFILFDPVQFIRHGWIERNRVLKQGGGWLYIKAPLAAHARDTLIKDIRLDNTRDWKRSMLSQLDVYKRSAPYYSDVMDLVRAVFADEYEDIVSIDRAALRAVCDYLEIDRRIDIFSEMGLDIGEVGSPDEWALNICVALGDVDEYWIAPGGREFFDGSKYERAGIKLRFQSVRLDEYDQRRDGFEPGLSIIDVMMFNSPAEVNRMLDDYVLADGVDRSGAS
jgi:hypothetical protein